MIILVLILIIPSKNFEQMSPLNSLPYLHIHIHNSHLIIISQPTISTNSINYSLKYWILYSKWLFWLISCFHVVYAEFTCVNIQEYIWFVICYLLLYALGEWFTQGWWAWVCLCIVFLSQKTSREVPVDIHIYF